MPKSDAQRRREADARKRDQGLVRVCVWTTPEQAAKIRAMAAKAPRSSR